MVLARPILANVWCHCGAAKGGGPNPEKVGAPKGGAPKGGSPKGGAPKGGAPKGGAPKGGAPKGGAPKGGAPKGGAKGGAPKGWGPEGWGPEGWGPKISRFFFPLPLQNSFFSSLSGGLLVEFWWCFEAQVPCTGVLRLSCASPGPVW